jgi:hypothetical protein
MNVRRCGVSGRKVLPVDMLLLDSSIKPEAATRASLSEQLRNPGVNESWA